MSTANAPRTRFRGRRLIRGSVFIAILAVAMWQVRIQTSAWADLKNGRIALEHDDPETARQHFDACLRIWPRSATANYLAAQAARRSGDLGGAVAYLAEADRLGRAAADIEVESALIEVQSGHLAVAESALLHHLNLSHPESPQILAVLIPAYVAQYRWSEAGALAQQWVELCPDDARAWKTLGEILDRLRKLSPAVDAMRRAVELTPNDRKARLDLSRLVLESRQPPDEAARHAEWLVETDPRDVAALVQLAACRDSQARWDEGALLLDRVIAEHSSDPKAFFIRGQIELHRGAAKNALPLVRRAAELDSSDPEILYTLFLCQQEVGTPAEAAEAEKRWRQCAADLQHARDLGKAISTTPHDPDLRRQMGELFLRNHRDKEGLRWLESALLEHPNHQATHRVLAAYYERTGQQELAELHHRFFQLPSRGANKP